jgi:hypothetical protein
MENGKREMANGVGLGESVRGLGEKAAEWWARCAGTL